MNKSTSSVRTTVFAAISFVLVSVFFSSCLKDHNNDNVNTPVAGLMTFNVAPDQQSAGFAISGNSLGNVPLGYTSYSGDYLSIYPGQRSVDAYDFNSPNSIIASVPGDFAQDKYYSVFLVGTAGHYRNVLVSDNVDSLSGVSGQSYIRYVNAIPDSVSAPTVTITAGGSTVVNNTAAFGSVSTFSAVNPGDINIAVKNTAGIDVNRTIAVEQRKVYTILLVGVPGSGSTPVEIKFIGNGTLDSTANRTQAITGASVSN